MYTVLVDRSSLESELSMMLGRTVTTPLQFDFGIRCSAADAFGRSIDLLTAELDHPDGLARAPMLASRLGRPLTAGLLTSYRHHSSAEPHHPPAQSPPPTLPPPLPATSANPPALAPP